MARPLINFVFGNLNQRGGGERLTLVTMMAVINMGMKFDLTTLYRPDISKIDKSFGGKLSSVMGKLRRIYIISILDYLEKSNLPSYNYPKKDFITINTHADVIPYYNDSMSRQNSIVYCHYPTAKNLIKSKDIEYLENGLNIRTSDSVKIHKEKYALNTQKKNKETSRTIDATFKTLNRAYANMMNKSDVLTNSEFSRKAILSAYKSAHVQILYPPVDVELFRKQGLETNERKDIILVVSRFDPAKGVENALSLARILKKRNIQIQMIILGSYTRRYSDYVRLLEKMLKTWDIKDYVTLKTNASLEELFRIIRKTKIYFHPKYGEHFGISIAESMAAGLVPIVPNSGGQTEFVPGKFQFSSLKDAADLVSSCLTASNSERRQISDSVLKFSTSNYMKNFQTLLCEKIRQ